MFFLCAETKLMGGEAGYALNYGYETYLLLE